MRKEHRLRREHSHSLLCRLHPLALLPQALGSREFSKRVDSDRLTLGSPTNLDLLFAQGDQVGHPSFRQAPARLDCRQAREKFLQLFSRETGRIDARVAKRQLLLAWRTIYLLAHCIDFRLGRAVQLCAQKSPVAKRLFRRKSQKRQRCPSPCHPAHDPLQAFAREQRSVSVEKHDRLGGQFVLCGVCECAGSGASCSVGRLLHCLQDFRKARAFEARASFFRRLF